MALDREQSLLKASPAWAVWSSLLNHYHPLVMTVRFCAATSFDASVLLDYLVSPETSGSASFLRLLMMWLKLLSARWEPFLVLVDGDANVDREQVVLAKMTLDSLYEKVDGLMKVDLFPYNAAPLLRWLSKVGEKKL
jgi:hypothetical protein